MKKGVLIPALIMFAPIVAIAETNHNGLYMGPTIQVRGGGGGDELEKVTYTDGDTQSIKGGNGLEIAAGWHVQPYRNSPFDLRAQVGYKYYGTHASNVNIYMDRVTWELIPSVQFGAGFWGGAGLLMHTNIKLHNDGVLPDAKYKNALGADFQLGWRWLALTYSNMKYKDEETGLKYSANNLGLQFTYSFGWTCCGGSDRQSTRYARTTPASVYSPPVPAPEVTPYVAAVAATPVAAPVIAPQSAQTQFAAGSQVVVVAGGVVRGQPSIQSAVVTALPNGRAVRLDSQRIDNAEGSWWLVSGDRLKGWVNEKDLQH